MIIIQNIESMKMFRTSTLLLTLMLLSRSLSIVPPYIPTIEENQDIDREDLIRRYFNLGLKNAEIVLFLSLAHGLVVSICHLKRILKKLRLKRR